MAYPEPIPILKKKESKIFNSRLSEFKLSQAQKEFYKGGRKIFKSDD